MKLDPYFTPYTKTNLKWMKDLNISIETIMLLEENIGKIFMTLDSAMIWHLTTKVQARKEKVNKLDLIKIQNICASKNTTKRVKRQPIEWGKIFADHISDKELVSRIYKELLHFNNQKNTLLNTKMGKRLA